MIYKIYVVGCLTKYGIESELLYGHSQVFSLDLTVFVCCFFKNTLRM